MSERKARRREPTPPFAALALYRDQLEAGARQHLRPGQIASRDRFEVAAGWEQRALAATGDRATHLARIGRAYLVGSSPRTRRGRWRRDLAYLEAVAEEATLTLSGLRAEKYDQMVADWQSRRPRGMLAQYKALRNQRQKGEERGKVPQR